MADKFLVPREPFTPSDNNLVALRGFMEMDIDNFAITNRLQCSVEIMLAQVVETLKTNPFSSVKSYHENGNMNCCYQTVLNSIKSRTNIRFRRPAKVPELRKIDYVRRLQYAQENVGRTADQWNRSVFKDEKTFSSTKDDTFWLRAVKELFPDDDEAFFVEDNSPIHSAGIVWDWFDDQPFVTCTRLNHCPRSPDLNSIEHLWSQLTKDWIPTDLRTADNLRAKLNQSWNELIIDVNYFQTLATSMTRRLQAVIHNNGGHTKY
uniref:Tc1-like transposase DDE domain-containing protein n=1 Tax=Trichogramma kaykai TaxID=54128 RepID=A0ABD2XJI3_9HYME